MNEETRSILVGTSGLSVAAAVALLLALARPPLAGAVSETRLTRRVTVAAIAAQFIHFVEEWQTGFHVRFPELLGLAPWPIWFFVTFNASWIVIWSSCAAIPRMSRGVLFPIWFLAIASVVNGLVHPVLALQAGGYFPGLWSSPLVGLLGVIVLRALGALTRAD